MPLGYPHHTGGWCGRPPSADLLPGWWIEVDGPNFIFLREGRYGEEAYYYHPQVIAQAVCIPPGHPLHAVSYPVALGRWFGEREVLEHLWEHLSGDPDLVIWAYREAGREMEEVRVNPRYTPNYMYPEGDARSTYRRMQAIGLPPVPTIALRPTAQYIHVPRHRRRT